jgi:hypothetical protein
MVDIARKALVGLSWLYVLGVAIQFFFAGLGILGGESMEAHEITGYAALHLTPILIVIVAALSRPPRTLLVLTIVFAVIAFIQPMWVSEFRGEFLGSFHILGALIIFVLAHTIAQRATALMRTAPA